MVTLMRSGIRVVGWALLGSAVLLVALLISVGAALARGPSFNTWVGWATVWALVVAAIGVALVVWDKITAGWRESHPSTDRAEDELAMVVLDQARVTRSQLLGTDEPGDDAANVRFIKTSGRFREVGGASSGDLDSVLEYYESLSPRRLLLAGEPGSGKTVLALELVVRLLEQREQDGHGPVPVLISAAAYDTDRPWGEWLAEHLAKRFNTNAAAMAGLIRDRRIVPVVDGLDEMDPSGQSRRARRMVAALNSYMQGRERAAVVVTSRRSEYDTLDKGLDRATHIEMVPMNGKEAADYLTAQLRDARERQQWQPLLAELTAHPDGLPASQLSTPWRLMLALTIFRAGGHPADLLPDASLDPGDAQAAAGYARGIDALLLSRYVDSALQLHDPDGRYADRPVHRWLTALAIGLARQSSHGLSSADIVLAQWWRTVSPNFTAAMNVMLAAIPGIVVLSLASGTRNNELRLIGGAAIVMALLAALPPSPKRSRFRQLATRAGLTRAAVGFASVLAFWLLAGLTLGLVLGTENASVASFLSFGLDIGIPVGLVVGLAAGLIDSSPQVVRPRDVIHADGLFGLAGGLAAGFGAGLPFGLAVWLQRHQPAAALQAGLEVGLVFGLTIMIAIGGSYWVRYHIAVLLAAVGGKGPARFGALLDWARGAGILRESGIAYQFRHRELQDWLAPTQVSPAAPRVIRGAAFTGVVAALLAGISGITAQALFGGNDYPHLYFLVVLASYVLPTA